MKTALIFTSHNVSAAIPADHHCPLTDDIRQYTFCRQFSEMPYHLPCLAEHLLRSQVQAQYCFALSYSEYAQHLAGHYGTHYEFLDHQDASIIEYCRTLGMPRMGQYHSPTTETVFLVSPPSLRYLVMSNLAMLPERYYTGEPQDGKTYLGSTLVLQPGKTYTNVTVIGGALTGPDNVHIASVKLVRCTLLNVALQQQCVDGLTLDGGIMELNVARGMLMHVRGMLHGLHLQVQYARFSHVALNSLYTFDSYAEYCHSVKYIKVPNLTQAWCTATTPVVHRCIACGRQKENCQKIHARHWLCTDCKQNKGSYRESNDQYKGKQDAMPMFSFELETAGESGEASLALLAYGFIATEDGSVDTEYKSPRFLSAASCLPALRAIDGFADDAINSQCGTHIHVDCRVKRYVDGNVFYALSRHMQQNEVETRAFWGRFFSSYATAGQGNGRYDAFSLQSHYDTIEYRLPRYRNAKQYLAVIRFCRMATKHITDVYTYTPRDLIDVAKVSVHLLDMYKKAVREAL